MFSRTLLRTFTAATIFAAPIFGTDALAQPVREPGVNPEDDVPVVISKDPDAGKKQLLFDDELKSKNPGKRIRREKPSNNRCTVVRIGRVEKTTCEKVLPEDVRVREPRRPLPEDVRVREPRQPLPEDVRVREPRQPLPEDVRMREPRRPLPEDVRVREPRRPLPEDVRVREPRRPLPVRVVNADLPEEIIDLPEGMERPEADMKADLMDDERAVFEAAERNRLALEERMLGEKSDLDRVEREKAARAKDEAAMLEVERARKTAESSDETTRLEAERARKAAEEKALLEKAQMEKAAAERERLEREKAEAERAARPAATMESLTKMEGDVFKLLNEERAKRGLPVLVYDARVSDVARAHSADMCTRGYFDHVTPEGKQPWDRLSSAGVAFTGAAENISKGPKTAEALNSGFQSSPRHAGNRLNAGFARVGLGLHVCGDGTPTFTELFVK